MYDNIRARTGLIYYDPSKAFNGYTLFAPSGGTDVWVIDMSGRFIHRWQMDYKPMYGVLLTNGHLLFLGKVEPPLFPDFGGDAGILLEVDWDGNTVWKYEDAYLSHDFYRLENGNTMILRWVETPKDIAVQVKGGVPGTERQGFIWSNEIREINPDGKVVWQWIGYEHLDPEIDVICPLCSRGAWPQANACSVTDNGNILTSFVRTNTIAIIDKNSSNIIWRWGPGEVTYQHNPTMLPNGNILLLDNGRHRTFSPDYSRVIEVNPSSGKIEWEYKDDILVNFYASLRGGCQRLPNGNTLICEGPKGRLFEVTSKGEIVWEYIIPLYYYYPPRYGLTNMVFRAYRYSSDYHGLIGTGLDDIKRLYGPVISESTTPR